MQQSTSGIGRLFETTRVLSGSKSLYGAYSALKTKPEDGRKKKQDDTTQSTKTQNATRDSGATAASAGVTSAISQINASAQSSNVAQDDTISSDSKGGIGNRKILLALHQIHDDLVKMNDTVDKISGYTSALVRASIINQATNSLNNANSLARINETNSTQGSETSSEPEATTKTDGGSVLGNAAKNVVGGAIGAGAAVAGSKLLKSTASVMKNVAKSAFRFAKPLASRLAAPIGITLAVKEIGEQILDLPDDDTRNIFKELLARKKISWNFVHPDIIDVSYMKTLPKDKIQRLIDSGKFEGSQLGTLNQILKEPIVSTRQQPTLTQSHTIEKHELSESTSKDNTHNITNENKLKELNIINNSKTKESNVERVNVPSQVSTLEKHETPRFVAEPTPENEINVEEKSPEIQIPINKEKPLNFGVVAIKELNIEKLILPDDFFDEFNNNLKSNHTQSPTQDNKEPTVWSKIKQTASDIFRPSESQGKFHKQEIEEEHKRSKEGKESHTPIDAPKNLIEQISAGEGTAGEKGYSTTLGNGKFLPDWAKNKDISTMSMSEIEKLQSDMLKHPKNNLNSSAIGKPQIVKSTLFGKHGTADFPDKGSIAEKLKLKPEDTFSKETQDKIFSELLARRGLKEYQEGKISKEEFQKRASNEWASIANPETGKSSYGQHTGTSTNDFQAALENSKKDEDVKLSKVEPDKKSATLEIPEAVSSGDFENDVKNVNSPIQKTPDLTEDNLKVIAEQTAKPQAPVIIQQQAAPMSTNNQKPQNIGIPNVRNDDPLIISMSYGNIRTV